MVDGALVGVPRGPEDVDEVEDVRPWARREEVALLACGCCWEDAEVEVLPPRAWLPPLPPLLLLLGFP